MGYEPRYERFEVSAPGSSALAVQFRKAGFLTLGDTPELYFFDVAGKEVVVGISGSALKRAEQMRRFTREEKIDIAGLWLKRQVEAGATLESQNLFLRDEQLAEVAAALGIQRRRPQADTRD